MPYEPTVWVNALKDGEEVIQKGTPLTADNLNKIEEKLVSLDSDQHNHSNKEALDNVTQEHLEKIGTHETLLSEHEKQIALLMSSITNLKVKAVQTIAERDASDNKEGIFHVIDATGDPSVTSGWAQYIYQTDKWIKIAENESLDVILSWAGITGKPSTFTPSAHKHKEADITDLDKYTQKQVDDLLKMKAQSVDLNTHTLSKTNPHNVTTQQVNYLGSYTKKLTDDTTQYPLGISIVFVGPSEAFGGWESYGSVTTYKAYSAGGGTFQTFTPYGTAASNLGGGKYKVRFATYPELTWTDWEVFETEEGARKKIAEHTNNNDMHLQAGERDKWNKKSDFSGSYSDLKNIPGSFPPSNHTHDYNTLENKPYIPEKTSDLTNDSNFVQSNAAKITVSTAGSPPVNPSINDIWIVI